MTHRKAVGVLALLGALDSVYLLLHRLGYIGTLACTTAGGCDVVNTSRYSMFLGMPVALYGAVGYLAILAVALAGTSDRWAQNRGLDRLLFGLATLGAGFSLYLTYMSLFVIGTACPWCLASLTIILTITAVSAWGAFGRRGTKGTSAEREGAATAR